MRSRDFLIQLAMIHENPLSPRRVFSGIPELAADIKQRGGLLMPIILLACECNKIPGHHHYRMIDGERRFRAVQSFRDSLDDHEYKVISSVRDDEEEVELMIGGNIDAGTYTPEEKMRALGLLKRAKKRKMDMAHEEGRYLLAKLKLDKKVLELLEEEAALPGSGRNSVSSTVVLEKKHLILMAKFNPDMQRLLADAVLERSLTATQLARIVKKIRKESRSVEKAVDEVEYESGIGKDKVKFARLSFLMFLSIMTPCDGMPPVDTSRLLGINELKWQIIVTELVEAGLVDRVNDRRGAVFSSEARRMFRKYTTRNTIDFARCMYGILGRFGGHTLKQFHDETLARMQSGAKGGQQPPVKADSREMRPVGYIPTSFLAFFIMITSPVASPQVLVELGGVSESAASKVLGRLCSEGLIERKVRGAYTLSERALRIFQRYLSSAVSDQRMMSFIRSVVDVIDPLVMGHVLKLFDEEASARTQSLNKESN